MEITLAKKRKRVLTNANTAAYPVLLAWIATPEGLGLIMTGLSILGLHSGGSLAGSIRER